MKISTKGRYALEAVLDLALHASSGHESLKNISERRNISENYLEQIFAVLRRKGIVESIRGAQGGYRLARDAKEITAGEVIRAVEGPFAPVACIAGGEKQSYCDRFGTCATRVLWSSIMNEMNNAADSVTISDLAECYLNTSQMCEIEYYI